MARFTTTLLYTLVLSPLGCKETPSSDTGTPPGDDTASLDTGDTGDTADTGDTGEVDYLVPDSMDFWLAAALNEDGDLRPWSSGSSSLEPYLMVMMVDSANWSGSMDDYRNLCYAIMFASDATRDDAYFSNWSTAVTGWRLRDGTEVGLSDGCALVDPAQFPDGVDSWLASYSWGFGLGPLSEEPTVEQAVEDHPSTFEDDMGGIMAGTLYSTLLEEEYGIDKLTAVWAAVVHELDENDEATDTPVDVGDGTVPPAGFYLGVPVGWIRMD